ncbi:MAG: hypothetical protein GFGODING_02953 [Flavobacteriales bacterium]|nr:hypothetical protein [Flavobacteriales bacterium]NUQ14488.1 T9SS type A sorting domain-containing protein [Flavobacteriales bacterium]
MKRTALLWAALCAAHSGGAQAPFDLDTTFRCAVLSRNVNSLAVMPDGKLLVSGRLNFAWVAGEHSLARVEVDGALDLSWNFGVPAGGKLTSWANGYYAGNGAIVRRLDGDGYLDPSFIMMNDDPYFSSGQGGDYHVYPDGRLLVSGWHSLHDTIRGFTGLHSLVWFSNTGYLDTTRTHRKANNAIYTIKEQPDGKFLCSGLCSVYEGQPVGRVFRVQADGALDTTFQTDIPIGMADAFTALPDGRAIATGYFVPNGSTDTLKIIRLMPDGSLDPTFNNELAAPRETFGAYSPMWHTMLPDGRIAIHGQFYEVEGQTRNGIALLDADGFLQSDAFFGEGCGDYNDGFSVLHAAVGMTQDPIGNWYIYGSYVGYDDGTTNDPQQRFVSRLYGLNVGVEEVDQPLQLQVYPNPTSGRVQVQLPEGEQGATLQVLDAQGQVLRTELMHGNAHVLDLSEAAAGVYAVRVRTAQGRSGRATVVVQP